MQTTMTIVFLLVLAAGISTAHDLVTYQERLKAWAGEN